jgi:hypothetical protein
MGENRSTTSKQPAPFYMNGVLVEPDALRISGNKTSRRVEPKVMTMLVVLSERPGQLWTRTNS